MFILIELFGCFRLSNCFGLLYDFWKLVDNSYKGD